MNTPSAPAPTRFKRARAALAAAGLAFLAVVAWVVIDASRGEPAEPLAVTIVGFGPVDGGSAEATLVLSNRIGRALHIFQGSTALEYKFQTNKPSRLPPVPPVDTLLITPPTPARPLLPHTARTNILYLPADGKTGRLIITALIEPSRMRKFRTAVEEFLGRRSTWRWETAESLCPEEIQCPFVHPDGTIDPPRLVEKPK